MPVGDSHLAFAQAAGADGIELTVHEAFDWLNELGHITLENIANDPPPGIVAREVGEASETLDQIYLDLGGDIDVLVACRATFFIPVDLVHLPTGTLIEVDEGHHFTSFRLEALNSYPPDTRLGFDKQVWRELCEAHAAQYDRFNRHQAAKGFGIGGIQRERAYRDSLVDLATPAMGHGPLLRYAALDGDGAAAYAANKDALAAALSVTR